jgi:hypothetical protein
VCVCVYVIIVEINNGDRTRPLLPVGPSGERVGGINNTFIIYGRRYANIFSYN